MTHTLWQMWFGDVWGNVCEESASWFKVPRNLPSDIIRGSPRLKEPENNLRFKWPTNATKKYPFFINKKHICKSGAKRPNLLVKSIPQRPQIIGSWVLPTHGKSKSTLVTGHGVERNGCGVVLFCFKCEDFFLFDFFGRFGSLALGRCGLSFSGSWIYQWWPIRDSNGWTLRGYAGQQVRAP